MTLAQNLYKTVANFANFADPGPQAKYIITSLPKQKERIYKLYYETFLEIYGHLFRKLH